MKKIKTVSQRKRAQLNALKIELAEKEARLVDVGGQIDLRMELRGLLGDIDSIKHMVRATAMFIEKISKKRPAPKFSAAEKEISDILEPDMAQFVKGKFVGPSTKE